MMRRSNWVALQIRLRTGPYVRLLAASGANSTLEARHLPRGRREKPGCVI